MICLACHYANEDDARFCEQCGQPLHITCPSCGSPANAGARFCRHCGQPLLPSPSPAATAVATALPPPRPPSLDERLDQLQRYLPAHLADKILANRGAWRASASWSPCCLPTLPAIPPSVRKWGKRHSLP